MGQIQAVLKAQDITKGNQLILPIMGDENLVTVDKDGYLAADDKTGVALLALKDLVFVHPQRYFNQESGYCLTAVVSKEGEDLKGTALYSESPFTCEWRGRVQWWYFRGTIKKGDRLHFVREPIDRYPETIRTGEGFFNLKTVATNEEQEPLKAEYRPIEDIKDEGAKTITIDNFDKHKDVLRSRSDVLRKIYGEKGVKFNIWPDHIRWTWQRKFEISGHKHPGQLRWDYEFNDACYASTTKDNWELIFKNMALWSGGVGNADCDGFAYAFRGVTEIFYGIQGFAVLGNPVPGECKCHAYGAVLVTDDSKKYGFDIELVEPANDQNQGWWVTDKALTGSRAYDAKAGGTVIL